MFDEVRKELEAMGWPDGRSLKKGDIMKRIEEATNFIPEDIIITPSQRLFCLYANLAHIPKCMVCGSDCKPSKKKMYNDNVYSGWTLFCSTDCSYGSEYIREKSKATMIEKYGVPYSAQSPELMMKMKKTMVERYGVDHASKITDESEDLDHVPSYEEVTDELRLASFPSSYKIFNDKKFSKIKKMINELTKFLDPCMENERFAMRVYCVVNNITKIPKCSECERVVKIHQNPNKGRFPYDSYIFSKFCSSGCSNKSQETKNKSLLTMKGIYGDHNMRTYRGISELKRAVTIKYGVEHHMQKHIDNKSLDSLSSPEWMKKRYNEVGGIKISDELNVSARTVYDYLKKHNIQINPNSGTSFGERSLAAFVRSLGVKVTSSDRTVLSGREIDIYIPSKKLAIEFNGLFWHSTPRVSKTYHIEKTERCESKGIRLLHVFEDEWLTRQEQVKAKIKSILGVDDREKVYARKCEVVIMNNKKVKDFYEDNHIQGHVNATIVLGLKNDDDKLVAVMSFKWTRGYMELVRYATSHRVIGGFSKLLKHFWKTNQDTERLVSFADKRWSDGNMYSSNGWIHIGDTKPNYYYVKGSERLLKQSFRKEKIKSRYPEVYSEDKTERQMTEELGLLRIYDCGLMKFEIKSPYSEKDKGA